MNRTFATCLVFVFPSMFAGCVGSTSCEEESENPFTVPQGQVSISGSGATFPKPLLETWGLEFARCHPSVQVSYAGGGSGKGVTDITNKDVLFGGSDAPLSTAEQAKTPNILHIPETLGLVAVVYNVGSLPDGLKLDGDIVGSIYTGDIKTWDDPAIKGLNPDVELPSDPIAIVYRADSSGTTYVFTDWLRMTSTSWQDKMGEKPSKKPDWTKSSANQLSDNGNDGVGNRVSATRNSIGYIELAYVQSLKLKAAALENQNGSFVKPTTQGAQAAAASFADGLPASFGDWSNVSITDAPGAESYPVSSFSYILVYRTVGDYAGKISQAQFDGFRAWMWWSLHAGQARSESLGYAPLPQPVVEKGEVALRSMDS